MNDIETLSPPLRSEITGEEYDTFIADSPQYTLYASRWWLEKVAPNSYVILALREKNNLVAVWPLVYRFNFEGRLNLVMPKMTQTLGILMRPSDRKQAEQLSYEHRIMEGMIDKLPDFDEFYHKFSSRMKNWLPFHWHQFKQTTLYSYVFDDLSDLNEIWNNMRSHVRQNIRKAEKKRITVIDTGDADSFFVLNKKTYQRQGLTTPLDEGIIRAILADPCAPYGSRLFVARDAEGNDQACVFLVYDQHCAYYIAGGADPDVRDSGAQIMALWQAIQFAAQHCVRFDFEGSMIKNIENVFRGFGAAQSPYFAIQKRTTPSWVSWSDLVTIAGKKLANKFKLPR